MLAEKGWTGYEIDLESSSSSSSSSSKDTILAQAAELRSQIRLMAIPFPPVLLASGPACLVAQAYVEDNPASGLVMLHPPPDDVVKQEGVEFRYEPHFPVLLLGDAKSIGGIRASRVGSAAERGVGRGGKGVSVESLVDGDRGEESRLVSRPNCTSYLLLPYRFFYATSASIGRLRCSAAHDRSSKSGWTGVGID